MHLIVHFTRTTWYVVIASVIVLALLLSTVRVLLPKVQEYRNYFEIRLGSTMGRPVSIGQLGARMRGFRPELVLRGVEVLDPEKSGAILKFREMRVGLNLIRLMTTGEFQPRWVSVVGAELSVRAEADGSITIGGLRTDDEPPTWLFDDGRLELLDSRIQWQDLKRHGPKLDFSDVDVRIINDNGHHQVKIALDLPKTLGQSIDLLLDYRGDLFQPDCCSGVMYIEAKAVLPGQLLKGETAYGFSIREGTSDFRLWSHWRQGRVEKLFGEIRLNRPVFSRDMDGAPDPANVFGLEHLAGWFRWHTEDDRWQLEADHFTLTVKDEPWPLTRFSVAVRSSESSERVNTRVAASYLRLTDIKQSLAAFNLLNDSQNAVLKELSPHGELYDFRLIADSSTQGIDHLAVCGDFGHIGFNAWRRLPGINNLSGRICGNEAEGELTLTTSDAGLTGPALFRHPFAVDVLEGQVHWRRQSDGWSFSSDRLRLAMPDITTKSRFQLDLPSTSASPFLDLQTDFESEHVENIRNYVPAMILPKELAERLDHVFAAGTIHQGKALVYGPLDRFPFAHNDGAFQVSFDTEKLEVVYDRDWPPLTDLSAEFLFDNNQLSITTKHGRLSGASLLSGTIEVPNLTDARVVHIKGSLQGDLASSFDLIQHSPLRTRLDSFPQLVSVSGEHRIDLSLTVPLGNAQDEAMVDGTAHMKQVQLRLLNPELSIDALNGVIHFSHNGIDAKGIKASLAGAPAKIDIVDETDSIVVRLSSHADIDALKAIAPSPLWNYAKGDMNYRMDVRVPKHLSDNPTPTRLTLHSDLTGVEILLPLPIGKDSTKKRPFSLSVLLSDAGKIPVSLSYGEHLRGQLLFSKRANTLGLEYGTLVLGEGHRRIKHGDGLGVIVDINNLHLDQWVRLLRSSNKDLAEWLARLRRFDLKSSHVYLDEQDLGMLSLQLQRDETGWLGTLNNPYAKGRLRWPVSARNDSVMALDLDYLTIPKFADNGLGANAEKPSIDPRQLPDLSITAEHLGWKGVDYGQLKLVTKQRRYGQHIDRLELFSDNHRLSLSGDWKHTDFYDSTQVTGEMTVNDLGLFLKAMGKSNVINETKGHFDFALNWTGAPYRPAARHLAGEVNMQFGEGRLLTVEPGMGRALGMFNLDALKRMLLFDLSHLFGQGLAYDQVKGSIKLVDGTARIEQFVVDGVPVRIEVNGRIGLVDEDLEHIVTVTSKTGAAMGMAVLLAQQLTANAVKGIAGKKYSVTGSWDDPVITRLPVENGWLQKAWSEFTTAEQAD